jgi:hypothetical protein
MLGILLMVNLFQYPLDCCFLNPLPTAAGRLSEHLASRLFNDLKRTGKMKYDLDLDCKFPLKIECKIIRAAAQRIKLNTDDFSISENIDCVNQDSFLAVLCYPLWVGTIEERLGKASKLVCLTVSFNRLNRKNLITY